MSGDPHYRFAGFKKGGLTGSGDQGSRSTVLYPLAGFSASQPRAGLAGGVFAAILNLPSWKLDSHKYRENSPNLP
jgi:hypothetical protein